MCTYVFVCVADCCKTISLLVHRASSWLMGHVAIINHPQSPRIRPRGSKLLPPHLDFAAREFIGGRSRLTDPWSDKVTHVPGRLASKIEEPAMLQS